MKHVIIFYSFNFSFLMSGTYISKESESDQELEEEVRYTIKSHSKTRVTLRLQCTYILCTRKLSCHIHQTYGSYVLYCIQLHKSPVDSDCRNDCAFCFFFLCIEKGSQLFSAVRKKDANLQPRHMIKKHSLLA